MPIGFIETTYTTCPMTDWSKLITINYPHGYHGDFLACLVTNTDPMLSDGLTATYTTPGITSALGVKNLDIAVGMHLSNKTREFFFNEDTEFARRQSRFYCLMQGPSFRQNLIDDLRWQFNHLRGVKTVFNTHYCMHRSFLPLQEVFPESSNFYLTLANDRNKSIYDFLFEHKIFKHYRNTSAYKFYKGCANEARDDETPIYVDKLMGEEGFMYAKQVESMLDAWFDLELLDKYKRLHWDLLEANGFKYERA